MTDLADITGVTACGKTIEDAANELEMRGAPPAIADMLRRIDLERTDAMRTALQRAVKRIESYTVKGESYRKALKLAVKLIREVEISG